MSSVDTVINTCAWIFNTAVDSFGTVIAFLRVLLEGNYRMMSVVLRVGVNFVNAICAVGNFLYVGIYTILVCFIEFLAELANFVSALFYLIWKVILLVLSFLDLVFHSLESIAYFLWTGGKWTAETISISGRNLTDNGLSTWKYFVVSVKEFTNSVIGGLTTLGTFSKASSVFIFNALSACYDYAYDVILYVDYIVRYFCRYCFESVYFFLTEYLLNLPTEAYLGIIICCAASIILKNLMCHLCSEGLTFPLWSVFGARHQVDYDFEDYDNERGAEFSDDDDIGHYRYNDFVSDDNNDEFSVNSDYTSDSSSDEELSDEELEIDSDSDNESIAASESEMSEINIQLPEVHGSFVSNLRRSTTPSRMTRDMSHDDLQKFIESEKEKRRCVVCQDRNKSVLILPCRHMCLCLECGNHIARSRAREQRKCPLCRTRINTIMNVYL
ncbi:Ring finger protein 26 [Mactra antiquata]